MVQWYNGITAPAIWTEEISVIWQTWYKVSWFCEGFKRKREAILWLYHFVRCIIKKPPLVFLKSPQKAMILFPSWPYGKGMRIPRGICWGSSVSSPPNRRDKCERDAPLLTAGFETHSRRRENSLPVSRFTCVVSSYASRFCANITYQPHNRVQLPHSN